MKEELLREYTQAAISFGFMVAWVILSLLMFMTIGTLIPSTAVLFGIGVLSAFIQGWFKYQRAKELKEEILK